MVIFNYTVLSAMKGLQCVVDPQIEILLNMTNEVLSKIKLQTKEVHL